MIENHIGTMPYREAHAIEGARPAQRLEQYRVGQAYWCAYWCFAYVVEAIHGTRVTVRALADNAVWSHHTSLTKGRDLVLPAGYEQTAAANSGSTLALKSS